MLGGVLDSAGRETSVELGCCISKLFDSRCVLNCFWLHLDFIVLFGL